MDTPLNFRNTKGVRQRRTLSGNLFAFSAKKIANALKKQNINVNVMQVNGREHKFSDLVRWWYFHFHLWHHLSEKPFWYVTDGSTEFSGLEKQSETRRNVVRCKQYISWSTTRYAAGLGVHFSRDKAISFNWQLRRKLKFNEKRCSSLATTKFMFVLLHLRHITILKSLALSSTSLFTSRLHLPA